MISDEIYIFDLPTHWLYLTAKDEAEWQSFVNIGTIPYVVAAVDADDNIIDGPTDIAYFTCYLSSSGDDFPSLNGNGVNPGCLRIASPPGFVYNTILLSWTPINGAHHYQMKYRYSNWVFQSDMSDNWLRLIIPDEEQWNEFRNIGKIYYRITALDSFGNIIDGPTDWSSFTLY